VIKPAEYTPLTAIMLPRLRMRLGCRRCAECGDGDGRTGAAIVDHPGVDKIAFHRLDPRWGGSFARLRRGRRKKLSLELGGKSPFVCLMMPILTPAVEGLVDGIWFNQGQVVCAGSRLLVQERIAEAAVREDSQHACRRCGLGRRWIRLLDIGRHRRPGPI